ncbi:Tll0287-like domain-containing protein [Nitrospira sp. NS4]|uniref:Tll0287-like domain-containing protein n=1 Tax=Nitrospira sp. NS4 TaxID=3414498 RepID=UPI003C2B3A20
MSFKTGVVLGGLVALCAAGGCGTGFAGKESGGSVPAGTVVDYIHSVLEADRTFYTVHVVERMQRRGVIESSEKWREVSALPLPAQFVQESSSLAELTGGQVRYRLISLNPINKQSGPRSEFERKALEAVMAKPEQPYKGYLTEGGSRYFQAVYADLAVSPVCVSCHNADPRSPKHDYKLRDVLGAVLISIPAPE